MNALRVLSPLRAYRPRYADVAATLALLLAMGGTAYAAGSLGPRTVGTRQLKDHAVTGGKLHSNAVASSKLKLGSVTNVKLADGSVDSSKLADGAVTNFKLGSGVVTHSKLGGNSIDGSNVAANSLSLSDLVGADISGAISFSLGANTCGNLNLGVSGAQVGEVVLFSFTGATAVPTTVTFGGTKVTASNTVTIRACNVSASAFSVSSLGIRVVTFG
jgi:hypothetical protein